MNLENYDVNFTQKMSPLDYSCHPTNHALRCHFMVREENGVLKNKTQEEANQHLYLKKNKTKPWHRSNASGLANYRRDGICSHRKMYHVKKTIVENAKVRNFPGGSVVKNLPCNAGVTDSIPGMRTKIPHARNSQTHVPQLENPCAAMKAPTSCKSDLMQPNK